jgi:hypothetical protein
MLFKFLKKITVDFFLSIGVFLGTILGSLAITAVGLLLCMGLGWCFQWIPLVQPLFDKGTRYPGYIAIGMGVLLIGMLIWTGTEHLVKTWKELKKAK